MPDILQDFPVQAPVSRIFAAITEPALIDRWWTLRSQGQPAVGSPYDLDFGPNYLWRAVVTRCVPDRAFELQMTNADSDWEGTFVGFELTESGQTTRVRFYHRGWPEPNEHYRISCHCWALYLRILRRYLEFNESVPYEKRLNV
jgi:uncharacterized protein YndB with AHSA1/START domain